MQISSSTMLWAGRILTTIFALFMLVASIAPKLVGARVASDTLVQLGWPGDYALMIGLIELACLVLYLMPRTRLLGAVLMMGLLGGAMATQIRAGSPLFSHILFSLYLGLFMWAVCGSATQRCEPNSQCRKRVIKT
jgi:DoxX-like family